MAGTTVEAGEARGGDAGKMSAVAPFVRFTFFGGGVTLLGSAALMIVGHRAPVAAANAVVTVVTTLLATELHSRFTFRRGRARWSDHCASGFTVLMSYLFTTAALLGYDAFHTGGAMLRQGVYLTASGAAGVARFLLLRYVFSRTRRRSAPAPSPRRALAFWAARTPLSAPATPVAPSAAPAALAAGAAPVPRPAVRAVPPAPAVGPATPPVGLSALSALSVLAASIPAPGVKPTLWGTAAASPLEPAPSFPSAFGR